MSYKIGIVGAPGAGKTAFGAALYAELLIRGVEGAFLIPEYAKEHLANGKTLRTFLDQFTVTNEQILREQQYEKTLFSPIICDTCVWLGGIYAKLMGLRRHTQLDEYFIRLDSVDYDLTIFVPLPNTDDHTSQYRIHDAKQSLDIQDLILTELETKRNVHVAPKLFKDRAQFIKNICEGITYE